ncbi:MAG: GNAT family N-acetyltransferase [Candidatus Aenigmarchaeota archaeon]|nr:GNAT family N-acetyltransferase [Candidatus Aenigmarchaeota archaeon]
MVRDSITPSIRSPKDMNNVMGARKSCLLHMLLSRKGIELSDDVISNICGIWTKAFGLKANGPADRKQFDNNQFFMVSEKKRILSVGRVIPVRGVLFNGRAYSILGIGGIVSVMKGKGHGSQLMHAIHDYLAKSKQTGIGFCRKGVAPFYEKCGFKTAPIANRFVYTNPEGKLMLDERSTDVLYVSGKDSFIEIVLANPREKIMLPCPHW